MSTLREVRVVAYDPAWPQAYMAEAARVAPLFGEELIALDHIGSTSVPGLRAKPIIDILAVVRDLERVDALDAGFVVAGYSPRGENGIPGRRFFSRGEQPRTHHIHAYAPGHPEIRRHLAFRDYLRAHPHEAEAYGALKTALAAQFPRDIDSYIAGKDAFVKALIERALAWYGGTPEA